MKNLIKKVIILTGIAMFVIINSTSGMTNAYCYENEKGTADNPILISTEQDLIDLATMVNDGNDCEGMYFEQIANITVNDLKPIGVDQDSNTVAFNGTYNGNNHSISGTIGDELKNNQALFALVGSNGYLENIVNKATVKGNSDVSAIASYNWGIIKNCSNSGEIIGCKNVSGITCTNKGSIYNCKNTGNISGSYDISGISSFNRGTILNCENTGNIECLEESAGGINAGNCGIIRGCKNIGDVNCSGDYVGGIAGSNSNSVVDCINSGFVSGTGDNVGDIVGSEFSGEVIDCLSVKYL